MTRTTRNYGQWMLFCTMAGLLLAGTAVADDDWGADLKLYGWLPILSIEKELTLNGPFAAAIFHW